VLALPACLHNLLCLPAYSAFLQGGGLRDSFLVDGVAFKKTFSYAGFEMQPKKYEVGGME
jgi:hypothetical protein